LSGIVDPYSYIDRLDMPKLVINGSGDQFFLPDSSRFYFHDLIGQKSLRYVPNADHGLNGSAHDSLAAFYLSILNSQPMPEFSWSISPEGGRIVVKSSTTPVEVKMWQAENGTARDFRLETIGPVWHSTPLAENNNGEYVASLDIPAKGWAAFFVELTFAANQGMTHMLTTDISIVPDRLPYSSEK
ncbi:MAG: PhoPQ-activated pathogenicity, partial [Verrucomicrobia bacterium]